MPVRNSAKAVIMKDGCVLLTKNQHEQEIFYLFPGGGQEHGETLEEAVKRECIEEIGQEVVVRELLHVREYIGRNHEHAFFDQNGCSPLPEDYYLLSLATSFEQSPQVGCRQIE